MPWLNWPNRITIARIVLVAPLVICLLNLNEGWPGWRHVTLVLFVLLAGSDGIDGFLARRLHEETPLGKFLDPLADKLLIACAVVILAIDATAVPGFRLPSWVPVIAVGKDLLTVIGFLLVHATTDKYFIRPRFLGKACTLVQFVMVALVLLGPDLPQAARPVVALSWWIASGLAIAAVVDYLRIGNRFAAEQHRAAIAP
ncbi:MAG: CDP-alcohol phosphatidyltransferase family protein [Planctomycetes bacterium]|nr:CDP-alcohol phosphatidyltransferase family protein [Planctomycetota bacterium]